MCRARASLVALLLLIPAACIVRVRTIDVQPQEIPDRTVNVETAVRAHLLDGSVVVFRRGVTFGDGRMVGSGEAFDALRTPVGMKTVVPLDSVIGVESFRHRTNEAATIMASLPTTLAGAGLAATAVGVAAIMIFGSCPTIYSDSSGVPVLESEAFPYSIAALFEMRDVDLLRSGADSTGAVRLEVRNEALETHYINLIELLEVRHGPSELVFPDVRGSAIAVARIDTAWTAVDRAGRDVRAVLARQDRVEFRTADQLLERARAQGVEDFLELVFEMAEPADSVALVMGLRNSLLNTILFYDLMLADAGARSLDWIGRDLETIGPAVELGRWYSRTMGMRISVWDGVAWQLVDRVPDAGPIAWKDLAVMLPVLEPSRLRVRLSFLADSWHVDRVAVGTPARRVDARRVPVARVVLADGSTDASLRGDIADPDERYLVTLPGQLFHAVFEAGPLPATVKRTFLLATQGYYTEWVRPQWIRRAEPNAGPFQPTDSTLVRLLDRWSQQKSSFEAQFHSSRISVR